MKRLRVSDIEALFERDQPGAGRAAAERLVQAVKDNRGRRKYTVMVEYIYNMEMEIEARSQIEARRIAERRVAAAGWADSPEGLGAGQSYRSRIAPERLNVDATNENADWLRRLDDEEYPLGGPAVEVMPEGKHAARGKEVPTVVETAKGPGSTPRPKRQPRPSRD